MRQYNTELKKSILGDDLAELNNISYKYRINQSEFVITGGVSLFLAGIRGYDDIDLCLSHKAKTKLITLVHRNNDIIVNKCTAIKFKNFKRVEINRGNIFLYAGLTDDEVINNPIYHIKYLDYKIVRVELQFARKIYRCTSRKLIRKKDIKDIFLVASKISRIESWNWALVKPPNSKKNRVVFNVIRWMAIVISKIKP